MTPHATVPLTFTTGEAEGITGIPVTVIEVWCRFGLLHPQRKASGRGFHRRWRDEDLTMMVIIGELWRAGLSMPQLQKAVAVLRGKLARTEAAFRPLAAFTDYVKTIEILATTFGRGDGYEQWRTAARSHLDRMQQAATARALPPVAGAEADDAALDRELLIAMSRLPASGVNLRPRPRIARQVPS